MVREIVVQRRNRSVSTIFSNVQSLAFFIYPRLCMKQAINLMVTNLLISVTEKMLQLLLMLMDNQSHKCDLKLNDHVKTFPNKVAWRAKMTIVFTHTSSLPIQRKIQSLSKKQTNSRLIQELKTDNLDAQKPMDPGSTKTQITFQAVSTFPRIYLSCTQTATSPILSTACYTEKRKTFYCLAKQPVTQYPLNKPALNIMIFQR